MSDKNKSNEEKTADNIKQAKQDRCDRIAAGKPTYDDLYGNRPGPSGPPGNSRTGPGWRRGA